MDHEAVRAPRQSPPPSPWPDRAALAAWFALALALFTAATAASPMVDEGVHLHRGLVGWQTGDMRLSYAQPPLGNLVSALPPLWLRPPLTPPVGPAWDEADNTALTNRWVDTDYEGFRDRLMLARPVSAVWALALVAGLAVAVRRRFGARAALVTVGVLATSPLLLASGVEVMVDLPMACFAALALVPVASVLERRGARWILVAGLLLGGAVASKHNGVGALAAAVGVTWLAAWRGWWGCAGVAPRARARWAALVTAAWVVLVALVVNVSYGFQDTGLTVGELLDRPEPQNHVTRPWRHGLLEGRSPLPALPRWLPVPLPAAFVVGVVSAEDRALGGRPQHFLGALRGPPFPLFHAVLCLLQTSLLALALLPRAARRLWRAKAAEVDPLVAGALALALAFVVGASLSRLFIGARHVLPVVPALAVLAGWAARDASWPRWAWLALGAVSFLDVATAWPVFKGDFNLLVPTRAAQRFVAVHGEDREQDTAALGRELRRLGVTDVSYFAWSHAAGHELRRAGLTVRRPPCGPPLEGPGWVAVHEHLLEGDPTCLRWLEGQAHTWVEHVRLYRLSGPAGP